MELEINNKRCQVCYEDVFKYKCPRCSKRTCSVKCVNSHKIADGCNGVRDKTAFVAIRNFTENHLLSDYRFLEDADRAADNATRNSKKFPYKNHNNKRFLKRAASRKGVELLLLPNMFTKHKQNSSRTFKESPNTIHWCVKWKFPQSDYAEVLEKNVPDNLTVSKALMKYIHSTKSDPVHRQRFKNYVSEEIDNIRIYMEYDRSTQNNRKYYGLDPQRSIEENLKGKLVIEYPTIHVVLKTNAMKYEENVLKNNPAKEKKYKIVKNDSKHVYQNGHTEDWNGSLTFGLLEDREEKMEQQEKGSESHKVTRLELVDKDIMDHQAKPDYSKGDAAFGMVGNLEEEMKEKRNRLEDWENHRSLELTICKDEEMKEQKNEHDKQEKSAALCFVSDQEVEMKEQIDVPADLGECATFGLSCNEEEEMEQQPCVSKVVKENDLVFKLNHDQNEEWEVKNCLDNLIKQVEQYTGI